MLTPAARGVLWALFATFNFALMGVLTKESARLFAYQSNELATWRNLPAVFGGTPRDAVYNTSQYPGQTFKLAVRTHEHVLRVETQGFTEDDGTADFGGATVGIYPQGHELDPAYALDNAELRTFFYPRARAFLQEIANNREVFSS